MTAGSQGMSGDPECLQSATYEGRTLLPALGRKLSSLATQAEFPTAMLSCTRHLAPAKRGAGRGGGWKVEVRREVEEQRDAEDGGGTGVGGVEEIQV